MSNAIQKLVRRGFVKALSSILSLCLVYCALGAGGNPGGMGSAIQKQVRRGFVKALSSILSFWLVYCALGAGGNPGGMRKACRSRCVVVL